MRSELGVKRQATAWLLPLLATIATVAIPAASARSAGETTFVGRFACEGTGAAPVVGARVELREKVELKGEFQSSASGRLASVGVTGADGEWSFTVPRSTEFRFIYTPVLVLDSPTLGVVDYRTGAPITVQGPLTHYNDVPLSDFQTLPVPLNQCALWNQLRKEYLDYSRLMGAPPRYGKLSALWDGPNLGEPYTDYTTIVWPNRYWAPVASTLVRHEFAHTIRNASLGGRDTFLADARAGADPRLRGSPCRLITPQYAFHEGWAEYWAGDFWPAPDCPQHNPDNQASEGNVAWALARLERGCRGARRRMIQVLLDHGPAIHSLAAFIAALGSCQTPPLDPGAVTRVKPPPPISPDVWTRDVRTAINRERGHISTLTKVLPGLEHAAAGASCQRPPCTEAIGRKIAPIVARAQLEQARFIASTLSARVSAKALAELRKPPTQTSMQRVVDVPATLVRGVGRIGFVSMAKALAAAQPLARLDRSRTTRNLISTLTQFRSDFARASRTGTGLPSGFASGGETPPTVHSVPTRHLVTFDGLAEGSAVTASGGVTFGSASALKFHGTPPIYVCQAAPTVTHGAALAPSCTGPASGFVYAGTMARLASPARTVTARVGATQAIPGGLPVEIDGFDAAGNMLGRTAVLVGSSTNGQGAGPVTRLTLRLPRQAHPATFVAIFVNTAISSPARLVFDDLGFGD
jgi:hypothetical protein